ncbi:MAG: enolase C-terminal domain-like protein [Verrucomicrobiota bacterium]
MITDIATHDKRFPLAPGAGSDAIHRDPVYSYAVTELKDDSGHSGIGLAFTLGEGNHLVCKAASFLARDLVGKDVDELMESFGSWQCAASNEQQLRWLGPHKGVVQLALASVTNACWDIWAKKHGVPLWQRLLDLTPEALAATIDFSYLEDVLTPSEAISVLTAARANRSERMGILKTGYPGYDTSIGWFNYSDKQVKENVRHSVDNGFTAMKLKVGDPDMEKDLRRTEIVREGAGPDATVMVDCNQQWSVPRALEYGKQAEPFNLFWIEEPTHPDDILGHAELAKAYQPSLVAAGEHVPNRIIFKNYFRAKALGVCQVDAVRVAGVSEFLAVSLMAKKYDIPVVPHVGDMGQNHQHLVLYNHIGIGHKALMLEHIPHLQGRFKNPCVVKDGVYQIPEEPGMSSDLLDLT